jgi:hypothetical protein
VFAELLSFALYCMGAAKVRGTPTRFFTTRMQRTSICYLKETAGVTAGSVIQLRPVIRRTGLSSERALQPEYRLFAL